MRKEAIPLYLFSFVMIMPMQALLPVLPMIRDEISASYLQISFFVACLGLVRLFFAFPSGFLADRYDRKKILISSGLLCICGLLVLCFSNTFFELIVSRVLVGFGSILCNITVLVLLSEIAGPDSKGILLSMNNVVHNAGGIVGPALAGVLAGWYHWRLPFGVVAGLILMSVLVIVFFFTDHWQNAKWDDSEEKKGGFRSQDSIKASIIKTSDDPSRSR